MEQIKEKTFNPSVFLVSLLLHVLLMVVFATIQFSRGKLFQSLVGSPQAAIRALEAIEQTGIVMPKPSVKSRAVIDGGGAAGFNLGVGNIAVAGSGAGGTGGGGQGSASGAGAGAGEDIINAFATSGATVAGGVFGAIEDKAAADKSSTVSFFGNVASGRKVCFVVDCSGSMLGFFSQVEEKLVEVITSLQQDNFYGIVVFNGENILEVEPKKLLRASERGKELAFEFMKSIGTPAGRPDAMGAVSAIARRWCIFLQTASTTTGLPKRLKNTGESLHRLLRYTQSVLWLTNEMPIC